MIYVGEKNGVSMLRAMGHSSHLERHRGREGKEGQNEDENNTG